MGIGGAGVRQQHRNVKWHMPRCFLSTDASPSCQHCPLGVKSQKQDVCVKDTDLQDG